MARPNLIVPRVRRKAVPAVPRARAADRAGLRPVSPSDPAQADLAVATIKLLLGANAPGQACPKPNQANRSMRGNPQRVVVVRLSKNVTPKVNASCTQCVHVRAPVQAAAQRQFSPQRL